MTRFELDAGSDPDRTQQEPRGPATPRGPRGLAPGSLLAGKYRLEAQLGQGGMAVVWSAFHLELEVPVAIKLLRGHDASLARRLKLEARAAARLVHPAIVRILDVAATDDDEPFIVMELLTGETLARALGRGHISALRAVQLLLPIAEALAFAHEHGVIHRDLKPENVFLATEGELLQPKLLDFGIAKLTGGAAALRLTANGIALGSPSYMSPEQARGDEVDHLSDVWSFCVLLYKAIGGKAPFRGPTPRDIFDAILGQPPPPLPIGAGVDGHLTRIVLSGLNKDPAARPASMRLLGQQLARWLLLHGVPVDACGTPLLKWLSSEPPVRPRASDAPPPCDPRPILPETSPATPARAASPSPPIDSRTEITARELARPSPPSPPSPPSSPSRSSSPLSARKLHLPTPQRRHWVLWALAGVLVAVVSLGLTSGKPSAPRDAAARPNTATQEAPLAVSEAASRTSEPQLEQPLVASDEDASRPEAAATAAPATATPSSVAAPRLASQPRPKNSAPPPSRPALPF